MADLEKFKKHMNHDVTITLKNSEGEVDDFTFKPLSVDHFTTLMILGDEIQKKADSSDGIKPETARDLLNLYVDIVLYSYPELDKSVAENFVVANFEKLGDIMTKLAPTNIDPKKADTLKKIKEMQQQKIHEAEKTIVD